MFDWNLAASALPVLLAMAFLTWLASLYLRDVSIIDSVWALFFLAALLTWYGLGSENGPRTLSALVLVALWALRLSGYLTWRNWGRPEDRRYQAIRARNQPHYEIKSLVIVFALQAGLAWLIALPILPVLKSPAPWSGLDTAGVSLFLAGLVFETVADLQLAHFKARPRADRVVLDRGLWHYSRHPNYFGEAVVWWGFYLLALAAGAPLWIVLSPALITFLLVKVSGIPLLEQDLSERHPAYRDYVLNTSAFVPRPPRRSTR
jgi:steroid 5-alpha reductase family enzyme